MKAACVNGHPYTPQNTRVRRRRDNGQEFYECRCCHRIREMVRYWYGRRKDRPGPSKYMVADRTPTVEEIRKMLTKAMRLHEAERDMRNSDRTHCVNGHEFTEANTMYRPVPNTSKAGGPSYRVRRCRACHNTMDRIRYWTKRRLRQRPEYAERHPAPPVDQLVADCEAGLRERGVLA